MKLGRSIKAGHLAVAIAVMVAVSLPLVFFVRGYQRQAIILQTEAEANALFASQIINDNPDYWPYEQARLQEFLSRRLIKNASEIRRIIDLKGETVAQNQDKVEYPFIVRSQNLYDSGNVVAKLEIVRSLRPLLGETILVAVLGFLLVAGIYFPLKIYVLDAREEAKQALRESELFLASVFDSIQDGIIVMDRDLTILRMNPTVAERVPLLSSHLGDKCYAVIHGRSSPCEGCPCQKAIETGETAYQLKPFKIGENTIWLELFAYPLRDLATDQVTGVIEYSREITSRKQAEEALAEEAIRRRILVEQSRDGIVVLDQTGKVYEANQRYAEMLGYSPEEVRQLYVWDWDAQWTREELLEQIRRVDEAGDHFETRHRRQDGTIFEVEISSNGAVLAGQKLVFCVCRDISQRKAAERALRESEEKYRLLVSQIPAVVFKGYADWSIDCFDNKIETLSGYPKEDFDSRRRKWSDLILEEDFPAVKEKFIRGLKEGGTYTREYRIRKKSGEIIWVQVQGQIFRDAAGMIQHISGVIFDVTTRKRAEEALLKYEFIANAAKEYMTLIDRNYIYEAANAAYCQAHGKTREEVVGNNVAAIWGQNSFGSIIKGYLDQCFTGQAVEYEGWFEFGRRGMGCYRVSYNPYFNEDGTVAYAAVVSHDITERKQAEDDLRKERDLSLSIMESLPGVFYLFGEQGRLIRWNNNLEEISKFSSQEISSMYPEQFFAGQDQARIQEAIQTAFATGEVSVEADLVSKDGSKNPYFFTGRRVIMEGRPHLVGMGLDISARREMEEALKKRLVTLSRPLDDATDINFDDLFNLEDIQQIQDLFASISGVASLITHPDGTPITRPSNFCRLCSSFIRQTELGRQQCYASDAQIGRHNHDGPTVQHCLSAGLCNAGASIVVGGKHIANWLIGQVRDETEDDARMRKYARAVGVDEEEFIKAFLEVPVMTVEQFDLVAQALFVLANQLSALAYQNVQQARFITARQKAEEALKESENRFRDIADNALEWIWEVDREGKFTYLSSIVEKLLGYKPEELINRHFYDLFHPDDREELMQAAMELFAANTPPREFISRNVHKNGRSVWLLTNGIAVLDDQGDLVGYRGANTDITERLLAEEALKESENFLTNVFASIQDTICILDRDLNIVRVNQAKELAFAPEMPLVGKKCFEVFHGTNEPCEFCPSKKTLETGRPAQRIITRNLADREGLRHISLSTFPLIDAVSGQVTGVVEVARDITDQKQAEEALQDSEKRYQSLFEDSPLSLWLADFSELRVYLQELWHFQAQDLRGYFRTHPKAVVHCVDLVKIIDVNKATLGIYAAGGKEEIIHGFRDIFTLEAYHAFQNVLIALAEGRNVFEGEIPTQSLKGKKVDVLFKLSAIPGFGEIHHQVLVSIIDITERKRAEEEKRQLESQLLHVQKMDAIGTLAGGIAHDFNNILSALMGYTELALDDLDEGTETRENLIQVLKSGKRAKDLVKQILTFSRQDKKERQPVQVSLYTKEIIKFLRASLPTTIEIRQNIIARTGRILADPTQLHQVLINLCTNAAQAMEESGGVLEIGLDEVNLKEGDLGLGPDLSPGPYLRLTVKDTGTGMAPEVLDRIYEPFFTTKHSKGTGLGLAVVHGIVKSHEGRVQVFSEPGEGSCFQVIFPKIEGQDIDEDAAVPKVPRGQGLVLLVDDEQDLVRLWEQMLRRLGYQVVAKTDSLEALETFKAQPERFNLVLTDQTMPQMTGTNLARQLLLIRPDIPIVLCTGYTETIKIGELEALGIRELITKPLSKSDLALVLEKVMGRKS